MSVYLDQKYLTLISNRLPLFKRKSDHLYNCRCIICGDSLKHKHKARGYFFIYKTEIRYKCHNCNASLSFSNFLKKLDNNVHNQYVLEKYSEGNIISVAPKPLQFNTPVFKSVEEQTLSNILTSLDKLEADNEAVEYCLSRKIPQDKFKYLYYIDNISKIAALNSKYADKIEGNEPRLVIPLHDSNGDLVGVTCRGLRGEKLRYLTIRIKEETEFYFGLKNVNKNEIVYVVEGPLDSLFLPNAVAVGGTSLRRVDNDVIPKDKSVYIYDNQPRNKEVCDQIEQAIDLDYNVVIWPQTLNGKDINEMVLSGINVKKVIKENTFQGLTAKLKFYSWKRI